MLGLLVTTRLRRRRTGRMGMTRRLGAERNRGRSRRRNRCMATCGHPRIMTNRCWCNRWWTLRLPARAFDIYTANVGAWAAWALSRSAVWRWRRSAPRRRDGRTMAHYKTRRCPATARYSRRAGNVLLMLRRGCWARCSLRCSVCRKAHKCISNAFVVIFIHNSCRWAWASTNRARLHRPIGRARELTAFRCILLTGDRITRRRCWDSRRCTHNTLAGIRRWFGRVPSTCLILRFPRRTLLPFLLLLRLLDRRSSTADHRSHFQIALFRLTTPAIDTVFRIRACNGPWAWIARSHAHMRRWRDVGAAAHHALGRAGVVASLLSHLPLTLFVHMIASLVCRIVPSRCIRLIWRGGMVSSRGRYPARRTRRTRVPVCPRIPRRLDRAPHTRLCTRRRSIMWWRWLGVFVAMPRCAMAAFASLPVHIPITRRRSIRSHRRSIPTSLIGGFTRVHRPRWLALRR